MKLITLLLCLDTMCLHYVTIKLTMLWPAVEPVFDTETASPPFAKRRHHCAVLISYMRAERINSKEIAANSYQAAEMIGVISLTSWDLLISIFIPLILGKRRKVVVTSSALAQDLRAFHIYTNEL